MDIGHKFDSETEIKDILRLLKEAIEICIYSINRNVGLRSGPACPYRRTRRPPRAQNIGGT
jgi:hypothetical protein